MATYTSSQFSTTRPLYVPRAGEMAVAYGTVEITAAALLADTLKFLKLPAGVSIVGGALVGDDIDTGTETLRIDIGVSGNTDQLLDSPVLDGDETPNSIANGINIRLSGELTDGPIAITTETDIIGTVAAAPNGGGTGTLTLYVYYTGTATYG